jgi:hypothetical protein
MTWELLVHLCLLYCPWSSCQTFFVLSGSVGLWLIIVKLVVAQHIVGINDCLWVLVIV